MTRLRAISIIMLSILVFVSCGNEEKYPSTVTVKLENISTDTGIRLDPKFDELVSALSNAILSRPVLAKAANGSIQKVVWEDYGAEGSEISTEELIRTRLNGIISGKPSTGLRKKLMDEVEGIAALSVVLARDAGKAQRYSEVETLKILERNLDVQPEETGGLINITCYSDSATQAKTIADMIAKAFISYVEEENALQVERVMKFASEFHKARAGIQGTENIEDLRDQLSKIKTKYRLVVNADGNFERPEEISKKRKEIISLQTEKLDLETTQNLLQPMALDGRVRFLISRGNVEISDQSDEVKRLDIELRQVRIRHEEESAEVQDVQKKLIAAEMRLDELVKTDMNDIRDDLTSKNQRITELQHEIDKLEDDFFTGTAEYEKVARRIERPSKRKYCQVRKKERLRIRRS